MYYILDKNEVLKCRVVCIYHSSTFDEQFLNEQYKDNWCVYISDKYDITVPILNPDNTVRNATDKELIELGYVTLQEGQLIKDNSIVEIPAPNHRAIWNFDIHQWETTEDLLEDGEILLENQSIEIVNKPNNYSIWNKETKQYETDLNLLNMYNLTNINIFEKEIIEQGFNYKGFRVPCTPEQIFKLEQKYKTGKYVIEATKTNPNNIPTDILNVIQHYSIVLQGEEYKISVNLNGVYTILSLEELQTLIITSSVFIDNVEQVCIQFMETPSSNPITKEEIMNEIDSIGLYKCYRGVV